MIMSRKDFADLLEVQDKYLCPSNLEHLKSGAEERGYKLLSIEGRGKKAVYYVEPLEEELPNEVWKSFPLAPDYLISNMGRVKHPKGGILKGTNNKGYIRTRIKDLGQLPNHRMVMITFQPISNNEDYVVDHINGKKDDNRLENLRWVFQAENAQFSDENNTQIKEIVAKLVQKYGYKETKAKLNALLEENL